MKARLRAWLRRWGRGGLRQRRPRPEPATRLSAAALRDLGLREADLPAIGHGDFARDPSRRPR